VQLGGRRAARRATRRRCGGHVRRRAGQHRGDRRRAPSGRRGRGYRAALATPRRAGRHQAPAGASASASASASAACGRAAVHHSRAVKSKRTAARLKAPRAARHYGREHRSRLRHARSAARAVEANVGEARLVHGAVRGGKRSKGEAARAAARCRRRGLGHTPAAW
jgi:hypothetical protein